MIVCLRTVEIPEDDRDRFLEWIDENRGLREEHGILFELVLQRSARRSAAKVLQPDVLPDAEESVVVTAWASHEAFDAWIETPDRDRLTSSDVHNAVRYGSITRYDTVGGYLNIDGLNAVAEAPKEEP
jgi:hypothetical protein